MTDRLYDWQKFHAAVVSLVSSGPLLSRLEYARDSIHLLDEKPNEIAKAHTEAYQNIRKETGRLAELTEHEQEALAGNILSYFIKVC